MPPRTRRTDTATTTRCGACRAPLIRQQVDVLTVTANATPRPPGADPYDDPNHLTWCAPPNPHGPTRLRWILHSTHPPNCPHPHHKDHHCTPKPPADTTEQPAAQRLF